MSAEFVDSATLQFVKRVYDVLDTLLEYRALGSVENQEKQIRGFVIVKQATMFYKLFDDNLVIFSIYDNRQKPKEARSSKSIR